LTLSSFLDNVWPSCIKVLLWIGVALFFLCFMGSTIAPERILPALGFSEYNDLIIRLYGIFRLSWTFIKRKVIMKLTKSLDIALMTLVQLAATRKQLSAAELAGILGAPRNHVAKKASVGNRYGQAMTLYVLDRWDEADKRPYLYGNPTYWRARIAALLGDKEAAVNLLRQATKEGNTYSSIHPTEDFESLADYPPYIQLMKPKG
jgi:hypothetical protein